MEEVGYVLIVERVGGFFYAVHHLQAGRVEVGHCSCEASRIDDYEQRAYLRHFYLDLVPFELEPGIFLQEMQHKDYYAHAEDYRPPVRDKEVAYREHRGGERREVVSGELSEHRHDEDEQTEETSEYIPVTEILTDENGEMYIAVVTEETPEPTTVQKSALEEYQEAKEENNRNKLSGYNHGEKKEKENPYENATIPSDFQIILD